MTENELFSLERLAASIVDGVVLNGVPEGSPIGHVDIGGSRVYFLIERLGEGRATITSLYSDRCFFAFGYNDGTEDRLLDDAPVPAVLALFADDFKHALNLDSGMFDRSLAHFDVKASTVDLLTQKLLEMLSVYDEGCRMPEELLSCCSIMSNKLREYDPASDVALINQLQTVKRLRELNAGERDDLETMITTTTNNAAKAAGYALLGQQSLANKAKEQCTREERLQLEDMPISMFF